MFRYDDEITALVNALDSKESDSYTISYLTTLLRTFLHTHVDIELENEVKTILQKHIASISERED